MKDPHLFLLVLQTLLALGLAASCVCRLVKMDAQTIREIRLAFWFEALAALLVLGAPAMPILWHQFCQWSPGTTPTFIWLLLLLAGLFVQIVTARHWRAGVPRHFMESKS